MASSGTLAGIDQTTKEQIAAAASNVHVPKVEMSSKPISPWYNVKQAGGLTPLEMGLNFGLVGASCVAAQGTVHWTRTAMVQQQLAGMRGEVPLGMMAQTSAIFRSEGMRGLYRGFSAAALREATYSSLRFGLYEPLKVMMDTSDGKEVLPVWKKVTAGLVAGAGAAAIASPSDLIMIQMAASKQFPPPSMYQVASQVIAKDGIAGLYKGIGTTVTRAAVLGATVAAGAVLRTISTPRAPGPRSSFSTRTKTSGPGEYISSLSSGQKATVAPAASALARSPSSSRGYASRSSPAAN